MAQPLTIPLTVEHVTGNMTGYTKLFSSITDSTVWREPDRTRLVWITMLAMSDADGHVAASVPGLADRARVPLEDCLKALDAFRSPDEWSRTKEFDGRRIVDVDGGWQLLNHAKYRAIQDAEHRREQSRIAMQRLRATRKAEAESAASAAVNEVSKVSAVNAGERPLTHTEADTEAEAEAGKNSASRKRAATVPPLTSEQLEAAGLTRETADEFLALRRKKRAPLTPRAWEGIASEADKAGWTVEQVIRKCLARGWQGFEAEWVKGERPAGAPQHVNRQEALEASNRAVGDTWAAKMQAQQGGDDADN